MDYPVRVLTQGVPGLAEPFSWPDREEWGDYGNPGASIRAAAPVFLAGRVTTTFALAWHLWECDRFSDWGAVIAREQVQGRGQLGRRWFSPPGNLYVSFLLPDDPPGRPLFRGPAAALLCGYCVLAALEDLGLPLRLKWPNDLVCLDDGGCWGKAAGLLLEERRDRVMAGLGVNLREAPGPDLLREGHALPAVCVGPHLRQSYAAPVPLWLELVPRLRETYARVLRGRNAGDILRDLESRLLWHGERVRAGEMGEEKEGILHGLGPQGELLLRTACGTNGGLVAVDSGSVARCS